MKKVTGAILGVLACICIASAFSVARSNTFVKMLFLAVAVLFAFAVFALIQSDKPKLQK